MKCDRACQKRLPQWTVIQQRCSFRTGGAGLRLARSWKSKCWNEGCVNWRTGQLCSSEVEWRSPGTWSERRWRIWNSCTAARWPRAVPTRGDRPKTVISQKDNYKMADLLLQIGQLRQNAMPCLNETFNTKTSVRQVAPLMMSTLSKLTTVTYIDDYDNLDIPVVQKYIFSFLRNCFDA